MEKGGWSVLEPPRDVDGTTRRSHTGLDMPLGAPEMLVPENDHESRPEVCVTRSQYCSNILPFSGL